MASRQTDFSGEGYLNVRPNPETATQKDITYPTPLDPQPPDLPAHFEKNSQAIANNMNYVYKFLHKITGINPGDETADIDDIKEKVNVPLTDDQKNYGQDGQGLASTGTDTNETKWVDFVEQGDFNIEINNRVPVGTIVMWYAANGNFDSENWVLCNGVTHTLENGRQIKTPDLQGRYPIGNSNGKTSVVNNNKNEPRINGVADNDVIGMDNFNWISNSTTTYKHACDREVKSITETYGYNASTSKLAPAIWGGGTHNHYISSQKKKVGGGTGKTVWVISGTIKANSNYYYAHGHAQDGHSHTFNHIHHMKGGAASESKNNYMRPPSVGVHFIMYTGKRK